MELLNYAGVSEIKGKDVTDALGHSYGKVSDILFSPQHRQAVLAIIDTGGIFKHDYTVVPFQALQINPNTQAVMVEIDKQTIKDAPHFDIKLLKGGRKEELFKVFNYYGYENVWETSTEEGEPMHDWYKSGENTGERHPENEGSYQITKQYPGPEGSRTSKEVDFDKMKGLPKQD